MGKKASVIALYVILWEPKKGADRKPWENEKEKH